MKEQFKNMMIGIFVVAALAIIVFSVLFIHPYIGDEGTYLRVRFTDIDKVNTGTRVTYAGRPIGQVVEITEIKTRDEKKGEVYVWELKLAVDSGTKVFNSDKISLRTAGLLGERSVAIDPESPVKGQKLRVINDEIIYAENSGSVEDAILEFQNVAKKADKLLSLVNEGLEELKSRQTWDHLASTVENMSGISDELKGIVSNAAKGEGTIGKLLVKDDIYLSASALLSKGQTILDDINHYGLLFQNDKGWQRLRARRMNLLQKLETPQEFKNFFNDELDQIYTAISRVSCVLEGTAASPLCCPLGGDPEFNKVFSELLRRVTSLEEAVKMYNIQMMDCQSTKFELVR